MDGRVLEFLKEKDIPYQNDVSASTFSTFRVGGLCCVARPLCPQQLCDLVSFCAYWDFPFAVIGRASNLLFSDGRVKTLLISTGALNAQMIGTGYALAQCGCSLPLLARQTAEAGYADFAFASGIPASVGGAVYMNAGAMERELSDTLEWVEAYLPVARKIKRYTVKELNFAYRTSRFQTKNEIVLRTKFRLRHVMPKEKILILMRQYSAKRAQTQPLDFPSAGSVFRRPEKGLSAGKLLDEAGLKGLRCGNAAISRKHAGFIVNLGGATAADVKNLIVAAQAAVKEKNGILLMPEIEEIT